MGAGEPLALALSDDLVVALFGRARELGLLDETGGEEERFVGSAEAARLIGCSTGRLHNLVSSTRTGQGTIPFHREGGRLVFSTLELRDWIKSGRAGV